VVDGVASVTLNRPERKNPLAFESYRELTDFFRACAMDDEVKTVVMSGAGGHPGAVHDDGGFCPRLRGVLEQSEAGIPG
jgi:enoyl-CoA hydratase/carnithine racemase